MRIGDMQFPATKDKTTENKINNIKEQAELYGLSFTDYMLYLIYDEGLKTYEQTTE